MSVVNSLPEGDRAAIIVRLNRIEGQVRGLRRMVEEGRDILDVVTQVAAIEGATNAVGCEVLMAFVVHCLRHAEEFTSPESAIEQAVRALVRGGR